MDKICGKSKYKKLKKDKRSLQREKFDDFSSLAHLEIPSESSDSDLDLLSLDTSESDWFTNEENKSDSYNPFKTVKSQPLHTEQNFEDHFQTVKKQSSYLEEKTPRHHSTRQRNRRKITDDQLMLESHKLQQSMRCINDKRSCQLSEPFVPATTNKKFQFKEEIIQIKRILVRARYQNLNTHHNKKQNKKKVQYLENI
ncbi:putative ORFan [Tupanvirus deep ocean]|uniref:ORFan n=2 Tax=Tupanvirus TaxID=2094720 RepID=A0AC62A9V9_9VIRU|nr:putative ORFan [Tupanvirus deep ocean]QKU34509.1 putative ORFan [Tupanvirus deep ocean]